ncbi:hypothetical protein TRAPUB_2666, partial [Trametes pubescens]
ALYSIPDAHQWARFCYYADRVRVLVHYDSPNTNVPFDDDKFPRPTLILPSVWFYLKQLSGDRALLPALRELQWMTSPFDTELFDLLCPSLQRICVRLNPMHPHTNAEWDAHLPLLIRNVAALAPELRQFEVGAIPSNTLRAIVPELHKMRHLRHLAVDVKCSSGRDMDSQALSVAELDTLEDLQYFRLGLAIEDDPRAAPSTITLRTLHSLAVVDSRGNQEAYGLSNTPSLRSFDATIRSRNIDPNGYRDLLFAFTQQFPDIASLTLTLDEGGADLIRVIEPLHHLHALRTLSFIVGEAYVGVSSAEVRVLLERVPHLSSLTIDFSSTMTRISNSMPWTGLLLHLAQFGSELTEVFLSNLKLSAYELDRALAQTVLAQPNTQLVVLVIGRVTHGSPLDAQSDLAKCAVLVLRLFPNLDPERCRACPPKSYYWETAGAWNTILTEVERLRSMTGTPMDV